ncbi:MAG: HNH endonuclease [Anaerolineales bacterium]|nr:HNH endonuclease [Anaerolineales bacterium]
MFTKGKVYRRRDLHDQYGGNRQSGICSLANHPFVFIFSGEQGEQYGYQDGWTSEGVFLYTGEGRYGDMEFKRGNKAIRDHLSEGQDLHLFQFAEQGLWRYIDQMICVGYFLTQAPDWDNNPREAIVFELRPLTAINQETIANDDQTSALGQLSLEELRERAIQEAQISQFPQDSYTHIFNRGSAVRAYVLRRANGVCEACGDPAPFRTEAGYPFLESHHIHRLSDGGPDHPVNVAAICPNCHRRAHHGADREAFNQRLRDIVKREEPA